MVPVFGVHLQKSGPNEGKLGVASRVRKVHVVVFQMNDAKSVARRLFARQTLPQIFVSTMRTMGIALILAFRDGSECCPRNFLMKIEAMDCSENRLLSVNQAAGIAKLVATVMAYLLRNMRLGL
jgi:hypothetical protein